MSSATNSSRLTTIDTQCDLTEFRDLNRSTWHLQITAAANRPRCWAPLRYCELHRRNGMTRGPEADDCVTGIIQCMREYNGDVRLRLATDANNMTEDGATDTIARRRPVQRVLSAILAAQDGLAEMPGDQGHSRWCSGAVGCGITQRSDWWIFYREATLLTLNGAVGIEELEPWPSGGQGMARFGLRHRSRGPRKVRPLCSQHDGFCRALPYRQGNTEQGPHSETAKSISGVCYALEFYWHIRARGDCRSCY